MAIEIRDFDGDADLLSAFVIRHWKIQYARPDYGGFAANWTPAYFRWRLPEIDGGNKRGIIAAYDGGTLVGVIPVEAIPVTFRGSPEMSVVGDWLTVDNTRLRSGIGRHLWAGQRRFNDEIGAGIGAGFMNFGSLPGRGRKFWQASAQDIVAFKKPRQWAQVLNGRKLAAGVWHRSNQLEAHLAGAIGKLRNFQTDPSVRAYTQADASACHTLFTRHMQNFDLAHRWTEARLHHHLGFGEPAYTLVLEENKRIIGFIGFHILDVFGRNVIRSGFVDMLVPKDLSNNAQLRLLTSAVGFMRSRDVDMVVVLGPPIHSSRNLLSAGFVPMPSSYRFTVIPTRQNISLTGIKSPFALFP